MTRGIDLNSLVGSEFTVGEMRCRRMRRCEPCTVVEATRRGRCCGALVHRGGWGADILAEAEIHPGDGVRVVANLD